MKNKTRFITIGLVLLVTVGLYGLTEKQIFGPSKISKPSMAMPSASGNNALSTDSVLYHAKQKITPQQLVRLNELEHSVSRGDVHDQQLHVYHQLAQFWSDTARSFPPFGWYTAEAARLENSEKSLTFAARLFLNNLVEEEDAGLKGWEATQAKDLFERSLKLNPANDSSKIGLGSVYLYGGIAMPMEGITMIREVAERDTNNVYAQWALGQASLYSGQLDKASDRFKKVVQMQPDNLEAILLVAEVAEQRGNSSEAVEWYTRFLPYANDPRIKKEVEARIAKLKK